MSGIFYTHSLAKTASNGASWAHVDAYFPRLQVFANVLLSAYRTQTPASFSGFQPTWAEAYIVTPETPMTSVAGISFPSRRDNTVFLTTDHLSFWLQVSNGSSSNPPASASAVGIIYDYAPAARMTLERAVRHLNLAVSTEDGAVVGTHTSVQLEGGPDFDEDETRERLLDEAHGVTGLERESLVVTSLEQDAVAAGGELRIDPSTNRAEAPDPGSPERHPFRS